MYVQMHEWRLDDLDLVIYVKLIPYVVDRGEDG